MTVARRAARLWLMTLPVWAVPTAASAITITLNGSVTSGYIGGGSVAGVFDITSALPLGFSAPYSITSASVTFSFQDDGDMQYTGQSGPYLGSFLGATYAWWGDGYSYYRHYASSDYYYSYFDAGESANVALGGGQGLSAASAYGSSGSTASGGGGSRFDGAYNYVVSYSCGYFTCYDPRTDYYYSDWVQTLYHYSYAGYSGPFSVTSPLTVSSIADLSTDGFLGYLINPSGDFSLTGASLTFTAEPNVAPVPEPGSMLLLGSGVLALALRRRRRA